MQWLNPLHKQIKLTTTTHCNQTTQRSPFTPPYPYFSDYTHILSQLLSFTPHNNINTFLSPYIIYCYSSAFTIHSTTTMPKCTLPQRFLVLYRLNKRNCDKNDCDCINERIFKSRPKDWSSICLSKRSCYLGFAPATVLIS